MSVGAARVTPARAAIVTAKNFILRVIARRKLTISGVVVAEDFKW